MQLTLGPRWVLELQVSIALRDRVDSACGVVRSCVQRSECKSAREMQWERDRALSTMSSGWERAIIQRSR